MISAVDLSYFIAGRTLLENTSLTLPAKHHFGLVGANGAGKTTFFRLLMGTLTPDKGALEKPKHCKILTVAQETPGGDQTPLEFLMASDQERVQLMHDLETGTDPERMGDIYERLLQIDAFSAEARASKILDGLGFDQEEQARPLSSFSGGFRMRVALGAALFQEPDILLLDEPTNHLDFEATVWLKDFLKTYPQTLIVISHDRDLLNHCMDEILHLHSRKIKRYKGNYDQFEKTFALQKMTLDAYNKRINTQKAHLQKFVDRFGAKASKAKQAQSRVKAIAKLANVIPPEDDATIRIRFPNAPALPSPILTYEKLDLGYTRPEGGPHVVLKDLKGRFDSEDRIALLGKNGNGKSTFAKFIAGELDPLKGKVHRSGKLRIGYFHQHQLEVFDPALSAFDHIRAALPSANETLCRNHLGCFGISKTKADLEVGKLSGGEKVRLAFSMVCIHKPHVLILDEPTNHLDMSMKESLIHAINNFAGAVVIISHDWHLLESTVDRLWVVANQTVAPFEGSLSDYKKQLRRGK